MNFKWNKNQTIQYNLHINDILVTIYSHNNKLHFAPYPQKSSNNHKIIIYYDEIISKELEEHIYKTISENPTILPTSIKDAYTYLGFKEDKLPKHINKYVEHQGYIYAHFAFPSDDFYMIYNNNSAEIFIWGNPTNLEKILISTLSMTGDTLPYHAGCIAIQNKGFMIIGDSFSGKTSIVLELLRRGASYISDDILYIDSNFTGYRCCEYLSVRKNFLSSPMSNTIEILKPRSEKVFINIKKLNQINNYNISDSTTINKIFILSPLDIQNITCTKLFPAFHHDSMIINEILGGNIQKKINLSMEHWNDMIKKIPLEYISIDYNHFLLSLNNIINYHFCLETL